MEISSAKIIWDLSGDLESWVLKLPTNDFAFALVFPVQAGHENLRGYRVHVQGQDKEWRFVGQGFALLRAQQVATLQVQKIWGRAS